MCFAIQKTHLSNLCLLGLLTGFCQVATAQDADYFDFFQRHIQFASTDSEAGPKLHTRFSYNGGKALFTKGDYKFTPDGYEDHTVLGIRQNFGLSKASFIYNAHHYEYASNNSYLDDYNLNFRYRLFHISQRRDATARTLSFGIPFRYRAARFSFRFSQAHMLGAYELINAYAIRSIIRGIKLLATWKNSDSGRWSDVRAEYSPATDCRVIFAYSDTGLEMQRRLHGEYNFGDFRLYGEVNSLSGSNGTAHSGGAIGLQRDTRLAALKMRVEYNGPQDGLALMLKAETDLTI